MNRLLLSEAEQQHSRAAKPLKERKRPAEPFLSGAIPLSWLRQANSARGSALALGLALWYYKTLRSSSTIRIGTATLGATLGLTERTTRRALQTLEKEGLIEVHRKAGSYSHITIKSQFD